jgi:3'-phosphoadenosine 5'-phosphosulfate sulfotransferase (PAPS reductase)/FAD synthetase
VNTMNPYFINEPAAISFSGGRTSAFMLYKVLEAHDGKLPDDVKVTFANTGKEMPQTLDFVQACSDNWGVPITWLESEIKPVDDPTPQKKFSYGYRIVNHATASRNGEPFANMLEAKKYAPSSTARFCTQDLKVKPMVSFLLDSGYEEYEPWLELLGIRYDEKIRAAKMHNKIRDKQLLWCPLYFDGVVKEDIQRFWDEQNFNLALPSVNGVTDWGNCDLCFLKGRNIRLSIMRERPDLADWWVEQEEKMQEYRPTKWVAGKSPFGGSSYKEMKVFATDQMNLFDFDDESIPCFCGD